MKSALGFDALVGAPRRVPFAPLGDRYSIIGKLRGTGRAAVSLGLPTGSRSVKDLVVVKTYGSGPLDGGLRPVEIPPEVEVASTPRHENLVRVVECGWDSGGHFIVSEYIEGTTLRRLLRWLAACDQKLPSAAVARILLGMFAAVEHANQWTRKPEARALVHQPIDATDVFITYAGAIQVLGFKPPRSRDAAGSGVAPIEPAAVDDLLSTQRSPELAAALARIGNRVSAASLIGLWQVARMLREWQHEHLRSDGRAELAEVMAKVQPEGRALRRSQLEAAVARVVRARGEAEPTADAPPVSGYRVAPSNEPAATIVGAEPMPGVPLATPAMWGPQVVSHLQREPLLPLLPQQPSIPQLAPPLSHTEASVQALALRAPVLRSPDARTRRRLMPWASLLVVAAVLAAGWVVARYRGARIERAASHPALAAVQHAPAASVAASPSAAAHGTAAAGESLAGEPAAGEPALNEPASPRSSAPDSEPKPAGAPARVASRSQFDLGSQRRDPRASLLASATHGARAPAVSTAPGYLTLDTTPWSAVSVHGASLGQTPLVRVELPPGQHLLELANAELGIATSVLVDITSGSTTVRRIGLEQPAHATGR